MVVSKASRKVMVIVAGLALVLPSIGCSHKNPLADRAAELPAGVELPAGFYPLKAHYVDDAQDSYDGWPRYIVSPQDRMVMAYVPSQEILLGGGLKDDEVPARHVVVNHFYIDIHEVCNTQYHKFAKAAKWRGACPLKVDAYEDFWVPGLNNADPVRNVSWREAHAYAKWAEKYLPTEAQWEAAARGSDGRLYPWGNDEVSEATRFLSNTQTDVDNFDGYAHVAPVMNFAPGVSPFGAFNMSGNVWEWCDDYYDPGRYGYPSSEDAPATLARGALPFGDSNYPNPLQKDIREARVGPLRGGEKVIRGGSYAEPIDGCRVDSRGGMGPETRRPNVGFRCVLLLPPQSVGS